MKNIPFSVFENKPGTSTYLFSVTEKCNFFNLNYRNKESTKIARF